MAGPSSRKSSSGDEVDNHDGMPPRIVVEQPGGEVCLGEDITRLADELREAQEFRDRASAMDALPGTERWVENRRLVYASALQTMLIMRRRATLVLLAIDCAYMLMSLAAIFLGNNIDGGARYVRVGQNTAGIVLDLFTIIVTVNGYWTALKISWFLHLGLLVGSTVADFTIVLIVRILILFILLRLLAVQRELDWVTRGNPARRDNCINMVFNISLGHMRVFGEQYYAALEASQSANASSHAAGQPGAAPQGGPQRSASALDPNAALTRGAARSASDPNDMLRHVTVAASASDAIAWQTRSHELSEPMYDRRAGV